MLSFDIQVEIIKRLPVKSLIRFRSVCKSWKSLIDSSHFIACYNSDQPQHLMIKYTVGFGQEEEEKYVCFMDDDSFPRQKFPLTVPPFLQDEIIIDSSQGLLCLTGYLRETDETEIAVIWNPAIRKYIAVVVPEVHSRFSYVLGFGVCPGTKDPMLVKITYIYDNYSEMESISFIPHQVMFFTLSSGEWTHLCSSNFPRESIEFMCDQAVIGQFIYFRAYDWIDVDGSCNLIMSFDMNTQEFREINLPDYLADVCGSDLSISRVRDSLVVVEYLMWKSGCDVWMMDHSKAFTKIFTIDLPNNADILSTLGFRKSGEPIVEIEYDNKDYDGAIVVYEHCSEHITDLGIRGNKYSFCGNFYTESLLLLDHDDGHIVKTGVVKT